MKITVVDSNDIPSPEGRAVLQALVSRSLIPIEEQVKTVNTEKTDKFISTHVIGYSHDSVLENADGIIINAANVSMLAAKALEDTGLFRGTEASTRYIDFERQPFNLPHPDAIDPNHAAIQDRLRSFYVENFPIVLENFKQRFPIEEGQNSNVWIRAVTAKTFDVMRAFLPCGAATTVNWGTELRHARDRITILKTHPMQEIKNIAIEIEVALTEKYPTTFQTSFSAPDTLLHMAKFANEYHYFEEEPFYSEYDNWLNPKYQYQGFEVYFNKDNIQNYKSNYPSLGERPRGCAPPKMYGNRFGVTGFIDFGSFRDVQRHRNGICKIPVITTENGFEDWYLEQLPPEIQEKANFHLYNLEQNVKGMDRLEAQYFIPMGYRVPFLLEYDLGQMIYFAELRSSKHVHPTARAVALHVVDFMEQYFPWVKVYADKSKGEFDIRRGTHSIERI